MVSFLKKQESFRVKEVFSRGRESKGFAYLKGRNIFDIDLDREASYIAQGYPNYQRIVLARVLPNRIFVDFVRRIPVAYIRLNRDFYIDAQGVLFDIEAGAGPLELPAITGLERKITHPQAGSKYNPKELDLALLLIQTIQQTPGLKNYKVARINVDNPALAVLFFSDGPRVLVNTENMKYRFSLLANLLTHTQSDFANIEYMDLRFKEPVIKFRDAAK